MNVDEYKKLYGEIPLIAPPYGFFTVTKVARTPAMPMKLHKLIDEMVKRLNDIYVPGAWLWMRVKNKNTWKEFLEIEELINAAIDGDNEEFLRELLDKYYEMWVILLEAFKPIKKDFVPF